MVNNDWFYVYMYIRPWEHSVVNCHIHVLLLPMNWSGWSWSALIEYINIYIKLYILYLYMYHSCWVDYLYWGHHSHYNLFHSFTINTMRFWIGIPNNAGSKFYTVIQTAVIFFFITFLTSLTYPIGIFVLPCVRFCCQNNAITMVSYFSKQIVWSDNNEWEGPHIFYIDIWK